MLQEKEIAAVLKEIYGNTDGMQFTPIEDVDVRQRTFRLHKGDKLESTIYNYYLNRAKKMDTQATETMIEAYQYFYGGTREEANEMLATKDERWQGSLLASYRHQVNNE